MSVKLLTELHLKFLSLKRGCRGSIRSTHVKMSHCWKSHAFAHMIFINKRVTKALIRLCRCEGWSASLLFANTENRFSRIEADFTVYNV